MDFQQLQQLEIGKKLKLEGKELQEFVQQEQQRAKEEAAIQREESATERQRAKEEMEQKTRLEEMLHGKEMATLHLEADKAKAEGLDHSTRNRDNSRLGIKVSKLPEFREAEHGTDAYLTRFERFAEHAGWGQWDYALVLNSILTGRALEVYSCLPIGDMTDYSKLKQAFLAKFLLTADDYTGKF